MSLATRVEDYKHEGMYIFDKTRVMCKFCKTRLDWQRKSTIDHCKSEQHIKKKTAAQQNNLKRQASISKSLNAAKKVKDERETFIRTTVNAFLKANIPPTKLDDPRFRDWLGEYVPGGGDFPNAQYLRDTYVPLLKALFKILPINEDPEPSLFVASVKILISNVDKDHCSKSVLQALNQYGVPHESVVAIASDSAPYMNLCLRLLRHLLGNPKLIHIQCWAHKLDKVMKIFSDKLYRLNECVANTRKLFKSTRKRKYKYMHFVKNEYSFTKAKIAQLFPIPGMTRWGSWRKSIVYLSESHVLYTKVKEVRKVHSIVMNTKHVKSVLFAKTKASFDAVSDEQQKSLLKRIQSVATAYDKILKGFMNKDTAKDFFESARSLFDPCKMMSCSSESVSKSKKELFLLDSIPFPNFSVLHSILVDIVKENTKTAKTKKTRNVEKLMMTLWLTPCFH